MVMLRTIMPSAVTIAFRATDHTKVPVRFDSTRGTWHRLRRLQLMATRNDRIKLRIAKTLVYMPHIGLHGAPDNLTEATQAKQLVAVRPSSRL